MTATSPFGSRYVPSTPEIARIAALPRRTWSDEAAATLAEMLTRELKTPGGTMKLRPVQAVALYEAMECGGLFGPMRVGSGKTLVTLLVSSALEAKRPLLLLPASLVSKTWNDRKVLAEHWRLPSNLQIESYESLSLVQSARKLEYIRPDLIIADEAHFLKGRRAGRTRRVVRYMDSHPETKFAAVSGTIMKASLRDFAHLLRFALKTQAPIPATDDEVETWADALDEKVNPLARRRPAAILELLGEPLPNDRGRTLANLLDTLEQDDTARARQVFQSRLLETRGVVASSKTDGVTCSIRVQALEYQLSPIVEEHFKTLRTRWETPCGKAFGEATEMRMYARELALGFSYTWISREKSREWESLVKKNGKQGEKRPPSAGKKLIQNTLESLRGQAQSVGGTTILKERGLSPEKIISVTEQQIQSSLPITERAPNVGVKSTQSVSGQVTSKARTESPTRSISDFFRRKEVSAPSAEVLEEVSEKNSTSIMTTRPMLSEGFCATGAIQDSASLGTTPLGLSEPLRTFLEQNRPPPEWLNARRAWCSFVREQIDQSERYDTMLQVANACRVGLLASETLDAWKAIESSYEPLTRPIFYEMTALETCLTWLKENVGIIWVEHRAFGEALSQLAEVPYFGPGGLDAFGVSIANAKGDEPVIASIAACGQGFNLQMFSKNLITSCPSGAATVEQVLGRTHRDGQLADEVEVWILFGCREQYEAFDRALEGAKAAEELLGHSQKLLLADICMPDISKRVGPLWQ